MFGCLPCFRNNNYTKAALDPSQQESNNNLKNEAPQTFGASAPPMAIPINNLDGTTTEYGGINFSDIVKEIDAKTDQQLKANEARYTETLTRDIGLQSIVEAKYRSTTAQLQQMTQFAEANKQNSMAIHILNEAREAKLKALQKQHQEALLPGNTQKKTPI